MIHLDQGSHAVLNFKIGFENLEKSIELGKMYVMYN